jgi:RecJ-like exonuclease
MNLEQCPECHGEGEVRIQTKYITCPTCEGEGEIPSDPVSHCQACGEPVEDGLEWCSHHRHTADLWQALKEQNETPTGWSKIEEGLEGT